MPPQTPYTRLRMSGHSFSRLCRCCVLRGNFGRRAFYVAPHAVGGKIKIVAVFGVSACVRLVDVDKTTLATRSVGDSNQGVRRNFRLSQKPTERKGVIVIVNSTFQRKKIRAVVLAISFSWLRDARAGGQSSSASSDLPIDHCIQLRWKGWEFKMSKISEFNGCLYIWNTGLIIELGAVHKVCSAIFDKILFTFSSCQRLPHVSNLLLLNYVTLSKNLTFNIGPNLNFKIGHLNPRSCFIYYNSEFHADNV